MATAIALSKPVWTLESVLWEDEGTKADVIGFTEESVPGDWAAIVRDFETAFPAVHPIDWSYTRFSDGAMKMGAAMGRNFETGAYRDSEDGKLDFEGFLSPLVLTEFAEYMHSHRRQSDGAMRASDNWQKGIPRSVYMKSMWRHFMDVWQGHRDPASVDEHLDALMALLFNVQGYAHEILSERSIVGD